MSAHHSYRSLSLWQLSLLLVVYDSGYQKQDKIAGRQGVEREYQQAVTKDLTSSTKFSGSCVLT